MGVTNPLILVVTPSLYRHGHRSKGALPDQPCYTVVGTISQHKNISDTVSKVVHQYRLPPRRAIQPTQEEGACLTMFTSRSFFALCQAAKKGTIRASVEKSISYFVILDNLTTGRYGHKKSICPLLG